MSIADSFSDDSREPHCLEDLSPREKIEYFVKGMQDNAFDLVKFRAASETYDHVRAFKGEVWNAYNALALVLSSIDAQEQAEETIKAAAKRRPTVILSMVQ